MKTSAWKAIVKECNAQMDYYNWVHQGYDDVFLTELQKDGTEKLLYSSEEYNFNNSEENNGG